MGGDEAVGATPISATDVSIHAPAWGATHQPPAKIIDNHGFNPRPRVGGDLVDLLVQTNPAAVSIHAPAWGAT